MSEQKKNRVSQKVPPIDWGQKVPPGGDSLFFVWYGVVGRSLQPWHEFLVGSNKGVRGAIKVSGAKLAIWVGMLDSSGGRLKSFPVS